MTALQPRIKVDVISTDPYFRTIVSPVIARVAREQAQSGVPTLQRRVILVDADGGLGVLLDAERHRKSDPEASTIFACRLDEDGDPTPGGEVARGASVVTFDSNFARNLYHVLVLALVGLVVHPRDRRAVDDAGAQPSPPPPDPYTDLDFLRLKSLSATERKVLVFLTEALSNKHIARRLSISDNTVRVHMRSIFLKLDVQNRTQAALMATRYRHTDVLPHECLETDLTQPAESGAVARVARLVG